MPKLFELEVDLKYIKDLIKRVKLTNAGYFRVEEAARDIAALEEAGMTREEIAKAINADLKWIEVIMEDLDFKEFCWACREHIPRLTEDQKNEALELVVELVNGGAS